MGGKRRRTLRSWIRFLGYRIERWDSYRNKWTGEPSLEIVVYDEHNWCSSFEFYL